jgi:hypothetical protein
VRDDQPARFGAINGLIARLVGLTHNLDGIAPRELDWWISQLEDVIRRLRTAVRRNA